MTNLPLSSIFIDGFRGLRNLHLEGLGRINILVGENNSGKTSVLEALQILCNPLDTGQWVRLARTRDYGGLDESWLLSLRWCFTQLVESIKSDHLTHGSCRMTGDGSHHISIETEYEEIMGFPSDEELVRILRQYPHAIRDRITEGLSEDEEREREPWRGAAIRQKTEPFGERTESVFWERHRVSLPTRSRGGIVTQMIATGDQNLNRRQSRQMSAVFFDDPVQGESYTAMLIKVLQELDPGILQVEVETLFGDRPSIYIRHSTLGIAPITIFGDAVRRIILLANTLFEVRGGGILRVDEIEIGIHISMLKKVFQWLSAAARQLDVQIIATTHSLEALDAIISTNFAIEDLVTYHLGQKKGETRVRRLSGEELRSVRQVSGLDPR